jgi:hypothetical protein
LQLKLQSQKGQTQKQNMIFNIQNCLKISLIIAFLVCTNAIFAQETGTITASFGIGHSVANSPRFPAITHSALHLAFVYTHTSATTKWGRYIGNPDYLLGISVETLGNPSILGNAFGIVPSLRFRLAQHWQYEAGLGLAYLDSSYEPFYHKNNTVSGAAVSFFGHTMLSYHTRLSPNLPVSLGLQINHYSNGSYATPNLGANVVSLNLSVCPFQQKNTDFIEKNTDFQTKNTDFKSDTLHKRRFDYSLRGSLGITERALDGPKYYAYTVSSHIATRINTVHDVGVGAEYIFNTMPYYLMQYYGYDAQTAETQAQRFLLYLHYELLLGYVGMVGEGGIYLNPHYEQHSIISTKIGANVYFKNMLSEKYLKSKYKINPYFGTYIRAYFGEAEFVEFAGGLRF